MARAARIVSESGYYHIVLRGNGKQLIFEDEMDRHAFVEAAGKRFAEKGIAVIAWCLMDNHVHLLLRDEGMQLSGAMHSLTTWYARYFNRRSGRTGHVFQARFASFPIDSDSYLLEAVRYIHNNPAKAGVCSAAEYWWSSYREYVGKAQMTDTSTVLDLLGGVDAFAVFQAEDAVGRYRLVEGRRVPDSEMGEVAATALLGAKGCAVNEVKALPKVRRDECLAVLRGAGLSVRQIERLTGVGSKTITRATTARMS